jgi:hypothetical protein
MKYKSYSEMGKLYERLDEIEYILKNTRWFEPDYAILILEQRAVTSKIQQARMVAL